MLGLAKRERKICARLFIRPRLGRAERRREGRRRAARAAGHDPEGEDGGRQGGAREEVRREGQDLGWVELRVRPDFYLTI